MALDYPYLPPGRTIEFVPASNPFMAKALKILETSGCFKQPTGAVLVKDGQIIGQANNAGKKLDYCPKDQQGYPTGQGYHLCREFCQQQSHAEVGAVNNAQAQNNNTQGADLYLAGHWWCCQNCWNVMISAGIRHVYLQENAQALYRK